MQLDIVMKKADARFWCPCMGPILWGAEVFDCTLYLLHFGSSHSSEECIRSASRTVWAGFRSGRTLTLYCTLVGRPVMDKNIRYLFKFARSYSYSSLEFGNAIEIECRVGRAAGRTLTLYGDILGCSS